MDKAVPAVSYDNRNLEVNTIPEKRTYTVDEVAKLLAISKTSAYALVQEGYFKTVRIGNAIRISKRSFDSWLDEQNQ